MASRDECQKTVDPEPNATATATAAAAATGAAAIAGTTVVGAVAAEELRPKEL